MAEAGALAAAAAAAAAVAAERRRAWEDLPHKSILHICCLPCDGQGGFLVNDAVLVRRTANGWEIVTDVPQPVCGPQLFTEYGTWKDREVTPGLLLWKHVVRPKDGIIDEDEVTPLAHLQKQPRAVETPCGYIAEAMVTDGTLTREHEHLQLSLELTRADDCW